MPTAKELAEQILNLPVEELQQLPISLFKGLFQFVRPEEAEKIRKEVEIKKQPDWDKDRGDGFNSRGLRD